MNIPITKPTIRRGYVLSAVILLMIALSCQAQVTSDETGPVEEDSTRLIRMFAPGDDDMPVPEIGPFSWLMIWLNHQWSAVIERADSLKTGYDPSTDTEYREIPGSSYSVFRIGDISGGGAYLESTRLNIRTPANDDYLLTVFGTDDTLCSFMVMYSFREPGSRPIETDFDKIPIARGATHRYTISVAGTPPAPYEVTGGFDGGGNQPTDINWLLSYVSVDKNVTTLPLGTEKFNLVIIYRQGISPQTFAAGLNGRDITDLFAPTAGGYDVIRIPLQSGENVLVLSIEGETSGQATTDTDSLVFVVEPK